MKAKFICVWNVIALISMRPAFAQDIGIHESAGGALPVESRTGLELRWPWVIEEGEMCVRLSESYGGYTVAATTADNGPLELVNGTDILPFTVEWKVPGGTSYVAVNATPLLFARNDTPGPQTFPALDYHASGLKRDLPPKYSIKIPKTGISGNLAGEYAGAAKFSVNYDASCLNGDLPAKYRIKIFKADVNGNPAGEYSGAVKFSVIPANPIIR